MKTIIYTAALLICSAFIPSGKALIKEEKFNLEMHGIVKVAIANTKGINGILDSAVITVFDRANHLTNTCYQNKSGMCRFSLPLNDEFTIVCSREGYVSKTVYVNTRVPDRKMENYHFYFDISLFQAVKGIDHSIFNRSIAKIIYNNYRKGFKPKGNREKINKRLVKEYVKHYNVHS